MLQSIWYVHVHVCVSTNALCRNEGNDMIKFVSMCGISPQRAKLRESRTCMHTCIHVHCTCTCACTCMSISQFIQTLIAQCGMEYLYTMALAINVGLPSTLPLLYSTCTCTCTCTCACTCTCMLCAVHLTCTCMLCPIPSLLLGLHRL